MHTIFCIITLLVTAVTSSVIYAADEKSALGTFDYPELTVTPRASDRLKQELDWEKNHRWTNHVNTQAPSALLFITGLMAMNDPGNGKDDEAKFAGVMGATIGATWLGITGFLAATYTPYRETDREISKMPSGNKRDQLARERLAEETISSAASWGRRLSWFSFATNTLASGYIIGTASKDMNKMMGGISLLASFTPLVFSYHWQTIECLHQDYKKRIYGPVAGITLLKGDTASADISREYRRLQNDRSVTPAMLFTVSL